MSCCFFSALFIDIQPVDASPKPQEAEFIFLPLVEENSLPMTRLLEFAGQTLGISFLYVESEVIDRAYQFTGPIQVPRSKFQGFFERLLLDKHFILISTGEGESAIHKVIMLPAASGTRQAVHLKTKVVDLSELPDYADRAILVTVNIPLTSVDARNALQSLNPYFITSGSHQMESIRCVENANSLIITTYGQKAYQLGQLIQMMDTEAREEMKFKNEWLKQIETRVAALEDKIKKLAR